MNTIFAKITKKNKLLIDPTTQLVESNRYTISCIFEEKPEDLVLAAIFKLNTDATFTAFLDENNSVVLPAKVLHKPGILSISICGYEINSDMISEEDYKNLAVGNLHIKDIDTYLEKGHFSYNCLANKLYSTDTYKIIVKGTL